MAEIPLPGRATRFDYQSLDPNSGLLYVSHMGDGTLLVFDTRTNKVVANLPGFPTVTGVLAVPEEGKVYASAAGAHEVVVLDMKTLKPIARVGEVRFPDGIAYASKERKIFVSDEAGGKDLVIDAQTNKSLGTISLGGEAGNTRYDTAGDRIYVAVQTLNEIVSIDPVTQKIVGRLKLPGAQGPHGFCLDELRHRAYISCEDNARLFVVSLGNMQVRPDLFNSSVSDGPDVLSYSENTDLYVGCESGVIDIFGVTSNGLQPIGSLRRPHAHSVAVDPKTHRVYVPLENVNGMPVMWVLEPR